VCDAARCGAGAQQHIGHRGEPQAQLAGGGGGAIGIEIELTLLDPLRGPLTRSAATRRTPRRPSPSSGYEIGQQKRKRVEESFGWGKTIGGLARMLRGVKKLDFKFILTMAAYDLIKLSRLICAAA
jgi:hypothetical protein